MKPPLASLARQPRAVLIQEGGLTAFPEIGYRTEPVRFDSLQDAESYLKFWVSDHTAIHELRRVLGLVDACVGTARMSNERVIAEIAKAALARRITLRERDSTDDFLHVKTAAILARQPRAVLIQAGGLTAFPELGYQTEPVRFDSLQDAEDYLEFWVSDQTAIQDLRRVLALVDSSVGTAGISNEQVLTGIAQAALARQVTLRESDSTNDFLYVKTALKLAEETAAGITSPDSGTAALVYAASTPEQPLVPVLPALEQVQIEGAEVLPEILQTLDQVEIGLETMSIAQTSLDPAPSAIDEIGTAMSSALDDAKETLDSL